MADPTSTDQENAFVYAAHRTMLIKLNRMHKKAPHLSWAKVNIRAADPDKDYYFSEKFKAKAIVVDVKVDKELCDLINCTPAHLLGNCAVNDITRFEYVGTSKNIQKRCTPACRYLYNKEVDVDEVVGPQVTFSHVTNTCVFQGAVDQFMMLPWTRSTTVTETNVSDLPYGFDMKDDPNVASGIGWEYNQPYCETFFYNFDTKTRNCKVPIWDEIGGTILGTTIYNMIQLQVRKSNTGSYRMPPNPGPPDVQLGGVDTIDGFLNNIPKDWKDYDVDMELDSNGEIDYENIKKLDFDAVKSSYTAQMNEFRKNGLIKGNNLSTKARRELEKNLEPLVKMGNLREEPEEINPDGLMEILLNLLNGITDYVTTWNFLLDIGFDMTLSQFKKFATKLATKYLPKLFAKIATSLGKFLLKTLTRSIVSTIIRSSTQFIIQTVSRVVIALAKFAAQAATVIGIILAVITVIDILLTLWDPFSMNVRFPDGFIDKQSLAGDLAIKQMLGKSDLEFKYDILTYLVLGEQELLEINLEMFTHIYDYLSSLSVNSEGSRIDHGDEVGLPSLEYDDIAKFDKNLHLYTPDELYSFEEQHIDRYAWFRTAKNWYLPAAVAGLGIMILLKVWVAALIILVVIFIYIGSLYLNISDFNVGLLTKNLNPKFTI